MSTWLITERLRLRAPTLADLDRVYAIHGDPRTYRHLPSGVMTRIEQAEQRLATWLRHWAEHAFGYAVITRIDTDAVIGFAGPAHATLADRAILNLYYRFAPETWGRGYAVEAASAVAAWCATHHPDVPLVARVAVNNPSSIRVAERIGLARQTQIDPTDPVEHVLYASPALVGE